MTDESHEIGMVLGTESATPLEWWVAIEPEEFLQLDDVVLVRTIVPGAGEEVRISGVVDMVRAQHEGSRFESDVFLVDKGVLPLQVARSAHVVSTRVEPELWIPPQPGDRVARVRGRDRDEALHARSSRGAMRDMVAAVAGMAVVGFETYEAPVCEVLAS